MTDHESYELLGVLAATRQLTDAEQSSFEEHCLHCRACRDRLRDLAFLGVQLQMEAATHAGSVSMPAGSLGRFRDRAIREGIVRRSAPLRSMSSYALPSVVAVLFLLSALLLVPRGRNAADRVETAITAPSPIPQSASGSIAKRGLLISRTKAVHRHLMRHGLVPKDDMAVKDPGLTAQQFPRAMTASYPFWRSPSALKVSAAGYPALSGSQLPHLALFQNFDEASKWSGIGVASRERPVDIASVANHFDFAADIRQLHFQFPAAQ